MCYTTLQHQQISRQNKIKYIYFFGSVKISWTIIMPKKWSFSPWSYWETNFSKFLDTHAGHILLVDDTPYKYIFNDSCSLIFLESFEGVSSNGDYLLSTILAYLVSLHSSRFNVQTYLKHNLFGTIKSISWSDSYYNMLFEYCSDSCDPTYCIKAKLKKIKIYYYF